MKNEFTILKSKAIPMRDKNVDTDQIIPARYLLMITKDGYGEHLFQDWRYKEDGSEDPEFILNKSEYKGAKILLAGENFGSGSSREHAVWALKQYGIDVVIAPSFSDIFRNNAYGNGLLVFTLPEDIMESLFEKVEANSDFEFTINLPEERMSTEDGTEYFFEINDFVKEKIVKGLDNIGYILDKETIVKNYEEKNDKSRDR
ncbi:MAG TPA: 3-isopropylmalate dehydratase small subunit [Candidatus Dojkabacteria bacterium]|jgi:3-isopropylmalate/(R)-2-methylmalate dehydratase small subunit